MARHRRGRATARRELTARFLYLASGYYDYDDPHDAAAAGHRATSPAQWSTRSSGREDLDYAGKRVVVIGSGATAVTIVPAMADKAAHVTMLQRTPTWMAAGPSRDKLANRLRRWLPGRLRLLARPGRRTSACTTCSSTARARSPTRSRAYLTGKLREELGEHYSRRALPAALRPVGAAAVPGARRRLLRGGQGGQGLDRDRRDRRRSRRTACGSSRASWSRPTSSSPPPACASRSAARSRSASTASRSISAERWFYRGCMFSNVPNLAVVFGYLNASWTLRADNTADYVCRVLEPHGRQARRRGRAAPARGPRPRRSRHRSRSPRATSSARAR